VWIWLSRILRSLAGVLAVVVALSLFRYLASTREAPRQRQEAASLPVVQAVECASLPIARRWTGYGTTRAMDAADIAAEVAGRVVARPDRLEAGVTVEAGELLLKIDPTDYEQRVRWARQQADSVEAQISGLEVEEARLAEQADLAREEVAIAERDLARARDTLARGAGNESQVDARLQALKAANRSLAAVLSSLETIPSRRASLRASLESARADLRMAEENLARTEIRAPISGVLQDIGLKLGEWARAGEVVARVVDLRRIEVPLRLSQAAAQSVASGDGVTLRTEGPLRLSWAGTVVRVAPESDASLRSLTVFVEVRQSPEGDPRTLLRPGQFMMGEVTSSQTEPHIVIPRHCVDVDTVLIAAPLRETDPAPPDGAARPMVVMLAEVNVAHHLEGRFAEVSAAETQWAVLQDKGVSRDRALKPGDLVLVSNLESLRPGDLVDVRVDGGVGSAVSRGADEPGANP